MSGDTQRAILAELAAGMQEITRLVGLDPESGEIEPTVERVAALAAAGRMTDATDRFTDMTARLAAADQAWAMQYCEPTAETDYIRFLAQQVDAFEPQPVKADVVTLCGSMRFWPQMLAVAAELTAAGSVVLAPFCVVAKENQDGERKAMLDALHQDKLRMAARHDGRVVVVSDESGYYGESTAREIAFALEMGLPVEYRAVASPAVPADEEAAVIERMAKASWDAADGFVTGTPWPPNSVYRVEKERRRARAVIAAWSGQQWYIGQEIEWNPTGDDWLSGFITDLSGDNAGIIQHHGAQYMTVETRHLRPRALAALREGEK